MSQPPSGTTSNPTPASYLGDFTIDRGGAVAAGFSEPPRRRPKANVAAGVAMLVFSGLIALQLTVKWTTFIVIEGWALDRYLAVLRHPWEPTLCVIAVTVLLLAVLVLCGGHRARFAAIAMMGALLIEEATELSAAVVEATMQDGDPLLLFFLNAIHVLGLGLAATAVGLLVTSASARWFDRRLLTRSTTSAASSRPPVLVAAVLGLTALALYKAIDYVSYMSTATGVEYLTRAELLIYNSVYELPPLIILVVAVVGLYFGSGLARMAAYVAAGSYCYEAATGMLLVARSLILGPNLGDIDVMSLLERLLVATVTVASLIALSRPRTVAWFQARRGHTASTATTG